MPVRVDQTLFLLQVLQVQDTAKVRKKSLHTVNRVLSTKIGNLDAIIQERELHGL